MSSQTHLEIYNPTYEEEHGDFPQFSLLPKELRLQVWRHSLQRHRIVKIKLPIRPQHFEGDGYEEFYAALSKEPLVVRGHQVLSKLLSVNSESREVALQFYRVRLSCNFKRSKTVKSETLLFNPEFDILHVRPAWHDNKFAELICKLKAADPQGVGVLRLALESKDVNGIQYQTDFRLMDSEARETFTAVIAQLEEVYFMDIENAGRVYDGVGCGILSMMDRVEFHRSTPIASKIPSFDLVARDPRPIADDLHRVYAGTFDGRKMVFFWRKMLLAWGIQPPPLSRYHFLVSSRRPAKQKVLDRAHAEKWLREEDENWTNVLEEMGSQKSYKSRIEELRSDYELERAPSKKNAIGFWLFPVEALGPLPPDEEEHDSRSDIWKGKVILDMSAHWPTIGLSYLP
ncbi:hypothetical protein F5Y13DRAFT_191233 [Hypoxylon sp. FL1857]|nr:hypothetical protein F5Y13DRAFT_191233 [Hypoxylon sp. FL1857]